MLESNYHQALKDHLEHLPCQVELPDEWKDYFELRGMIVPIRFDQRRFVRSHYPTKALLEFREALPFVDRSRRFHHIYSRDLSRNGICILAPEQLYPGEEPLVWLMTGIVRCEVVRCRRINATCYEIGARFLESHSKTA